jgi:chromosome segregation ATPase
LVREFQNANNEVYGLQRQVAALIDNQTRLNSLIANSEQENARLKSEVERLDNNCDYLDQKLDEEIEKSAMLCGQVERLTKAGDAMAWLINCQNDDAYYGFDDEKHASTLAWHAAKEGKQS